MTTPNEEHKSANADARAAKAKAKALRPWFKKKRFVFPIALVTIIGLSQAANGGGKTSGDSANSGDTNQSEGSTTTEEQPAAMPGIGDKAVDGKFEFTVTKVTCGIKSVGNEFLKSEAQGQYCQIALSIANVGDEAQTMFSSNQVLFDTEGREFSADESAMIYVDEASQTWLKEINPGNSIKGKLIFDVPNDAKLDYIELHDSAFSDGVKVSLK